MEEGLLTPVKAAKQLQLPVSTIRYMCESGKIKSINISKTKSRRIWRIPQAAIDDLLKAGT